MILGPFHWGIISTFINFLEVANSSDIPEYLPCRLRCEEAGQETVLSRGVTAASLTCPVQHQTNTINDEDLPKQ